MTASVAARRALVSVVLLGGCPPNCDGEDDTDEVCETLPAEIPFDHTIEADHIALLTDGGVLPVTIATWGAHTPPHTGHFNGDAKSNWAGWYSRTHAEQTELEGDGDGLCEPTELCGVHEDDVRDRLPTYLAPADGFVVHTVRVEPPVPAETYFGNTQHWAVWGDQCMHEYAFGHLGSIGADLRQAMIDAGYADPGTLGDVQTDNLITGDPLVLSKGASLATPQVMATAVPDHDGYWTGAGGWQMTPWAEIEFFTRTVDGQEPFCAWLPDDQQDQLAEIQVTEALDPDAFRYTGEYAPEWLWRAEIVLWTTDLVPWEDFSSIHANLGGWWETDGAGCTAVGPHCDTLFAIFRLQRDSVVYDATLYDSASVAWLVHRAYADDTWAFGEVLDPAEPDPVAGTLLVKWRPYDGDIEYQGIAYRVISAERLLKIRWGSPAASREAATVPAMPDETDPCDGDALTCHNHDALF
ncbi:MAG: hypothetical protein JRI25_23505 [Deltaproteobacteria bacterium]|nr:hypothetical protein [Deltaproteobacteria bacterium]